MKHTAQMYRPGACRPGVWLAVNLALGGATAVSAQVSDQL